MTWLGNESDSFAATIGPEALDRPVPGCPAWSVRDLVWHLGRVQRFWAGVVLAGADVEPRIPTEANGPGGAAELAEWMRASTGQLVQALSDTPWETPAWTWWRDNRTVGAIARHQVHEATVHLWDAQSASRDPEPIAGPVAADGVEEFLGIASQMRAVPPVTLVATDVGRSYRLSGGTPVATVSGTAPDLVLVLHRRRGLETVSVHGDRQAVEAFLIPIG
jgi:uncharacterized protein (TIGR03083 family)